MDRFEDLPAASPAPKGSSRFSRLHKTLSKGSLQLLVVIVGILMTSITAIGVFNGEGIFFLGTRAQNIAKSLALSAGETALVSCNGKLGGTWVDPLTRRQIKITCAGVSGTTPAPTPRPTIVATSQPTVRPTFVPGPTTTARPTTPPAGGGGGSGGTSSTGNGVVAASFGIWNPSKWDTCPKSLHDSYYVIATDGKKYPTWHPPVVTDPATGQPCSFGHEHGRDPSKSTLWSMIQEHFYYDANKNNQMDAEERAVAGIPLGYANEQLDLYWASKGMSAMRHEDHVGHKVEFMDDFAVRQPGINGGPQRVTDIKCQMLSKVHQGVHSHDAFTNNLHEVMYFAKCNDGNEVKLTVMGQFGPAGQMESVCDVNGRRSTAVMNLGKDAGNASYPGTFQDGSRQIITRECVDKVFLVPANGTVFSNNPYEPWPINPQIVTSSGKTLLYGLNLLFDVENASRFFDPSKPNRTGYFVDLCYLQPNGTKYRGVLCDVTDDYGRIKGVTHDNPQSHFDGTNRGAYMKAANLANAGGPTTWYTDPFGLNAQTTPFAGAIKQFVAPVSIDYAKKLGGSIDPTVVNRHHDDGKINGKKTVHSPN